MAFRKISYLIASCDGCGLAWSFGDPACAEGIPPHFASRTAAVAHLSDAYGWQVTRLRFCPRLMACRRCTAAGVNPTSASRAWLLAAASRIQRFVPFGSVCRPMLAGLGSGHPEAMNTGLSADEEGLLAVFDAEIFPEQQ